MPNWKKLIVSGSDAILRSVTGSFTGSLQGLAASSSRIYVEGTINNTTLPILTNGGIAGTNPASYYTVREISGISYNGTTKVLSGVTASAALGYPRIIAQGARDSQLSTGTLFPFNNFMSSSLSSGGNFRLKLSSSIATLTPGEYQIYLRFSANLSNTTWRMSYYITTTPNNGLLVTSVPSQFDSNRVPGSLFYCNNLSQDNYMSTILTPKFTVAATATYFLVGIQEISSTAALTWTLLPQTTHTNQCIIYRYDT